MPDAPDGKRRCPAKNRRGEPCRKSPRRGAVHCHNHGGANEVLPPGDPGRGGRPATTFRYSRVFRSDEDREIYELARQELGKLDEEIALARTNLVRYQRAMEDSGKGGIPVSVGGAGGSLTVRPYADVVQDYLDLIGKLEERRARILQAGIQGASTGPREISWDFGRAREITLEESLQRRTRSETGGGDA